jgi:branched-chain amino acid transport system permease protein
MSRRLKYTAYLGVILILYLIPLIVRIDYVIHFLVFFLISSMIALSFNLLFGYTGLLSIAQGGFYGIGAYAYALLVMKAGWPTWPAWVAGGLCSSVASLPVSLITFRLKGHYFAICTLALSLIITGTLTIWRDLTNGSLGIVGVPPLGGFSLPWGGDVSFRSTFFFYPLALTIFLLILLVSYLLANSKVGRTFQAIRENEALSSSVGVNPKYHKAVCFFISAMISGLAGGLYASYVGFIHPMTSDVFQGLFALVCTVVGGAGTILGPVVGNLLLGAIPEILRIDPVKRNLLFGIALIVFVRVWPRGIMGWIMKVLERKGRSVQGSNRA